MRTYSRAENYLIPPLEMHSKGGASLMRALHRSCAFPIDDLNGMKAAASNVTALLIVFWADAAASNRKMMKHIVASSQLWPPNALVDGSQLCLLHQLHRVRVQMMEAHSSVSLVFCPAKLARTGSVAGHVSDYICRYVDERCQRCVGPPPPAGQARSRALMDLLFRLDAGHHGRQRGGSSRKASQLWQDAEAVLSMDNGDVSSEMVHWRSNAGGSGPCCGSLDETRERMKAAYLNLFVTHGLPIGALSRWTHIGIAFTMLTAGFCFHDVFVQGLLRGLRYDSATEESLQHASPATLGATDDERKRQHQSRMNKVREWLVQPTTRFQVAALFMVVCSFDRLTYFLMGGDRADHEAGGQARRPGTTAR